MLRRSRSWREGAPFGERNLFNTVGTRERPSRPIMKSDATQGL
jgi:hypothetical protein